MCDSWIVAHTTTHRLIGDKKRTLSRMIPIIDINHYERNASKRASLADVKMSLMHDETAASHILKSDTKVGVLEKSSTSKKTTQKAADKDDDAHMQNREHKEDKEHKEVVDSHGYGQCSGVVMCVMMPNTKTIMTMEMQSIIPLHLLNPLLHSAQLGIDKVHAIMSAAVKRHCHRLLQHRGFVGR